MIGKKNFRRFVCGFLAVVLAILTPASTYALSQSQMKTYSDWNIFFYDPEGGSCVSMVSKYAADASSFGSLSAQQVAFVETYHDIAVMHSINYGIPWETVMAQGILESASGTSSFAINRNNFFGIGAFDKNPNKAFRYATPEEGWEGYYKNIRATSTYRAHGVFAGDTVTDPYAYLAAIKAAGYATDEKYVDKVSKVIVGIEDLSRDRGWAPSADLANQYPEWFTNAESNRQGVNIEPLSDSGIANPVSQCRNGDSAASLISGGMTLEQATQFMKAYHDEALKFARGTQRFLGALVTDSGCSKGTLNNCSAFTQWFLNKYTTLGPDGVVIRQGSQAVKKYLATYPQLVDGGKVPRPYAVMSRGPYTGVSSDGWGNHTGIVLGIDLENDSIIIGEASCGFSFAPGANRYKLSKYTNNSSPYGPTYAYTDNVLVGL